MNTQTGPFRKFLMIAAALLLSGCASQTTVSLSSVVEAHYKDLLKYNCTRGAHRGDSGIFLENSARAIHSACKNPKYAFIEFDVQYTEDKQVVVFHDDNLLRIFGRLARVNNSTVKELRELSNHEISTYEEIMELTGGATLNIEIKSHGDQEEDEQLVDYIVEDVKRRGIENQILISSISEDAIKYVKTRYPEMATGQIFWLKASTYLPFDFLTEGLYRQVEESRADYIMLHLTNRHNLHDLLHFKPEGKTIIFWDLDDTMYLVHKDSSDRLWSDSAWQKLAGRTANSATSVN